jgi:phosphate transport system permease protein
MLPAAFSGILTGLMMSIARVAGETAPLLFTAFGNAFLNLDMFKPMQSLPLVIFNYAASPYEAWHAIAWGASLVLMAWILLLNLIARLATRKWKVQF